VRITTGARRAETVASSASLISAVGYNQSVELSSCRNILYKCNFGSRRDQIWCEIVPLSCLSICYHNLQLGFSSFCRWRFQAGLKRAYGNVRNTVLRSQQVLEKSSILENFW